MKRDPIGWIRLMVGCILFLGAIDLSWAVDCDWVKAEEHLNASATRIDLLTQKSSHAEVILLRKAIREESLHSTADQLAKAIANPHVTFSQLEETLQSLKLIREKMGRIVEGILDPSSVGSTSLLSTLATHSPQSVGFFYEAVAGARILKNRTLQNALGLPAGVEADLLAFGTRFSVPGSISEADILFRIGTDLISVDAKYGDAANDVAKLTAQLKKAEQAIDAGDIKSFFFATPTGAVPGAVQDLINDMKRNGKLVGVINSGSF